jgi:tetratricopeptide (TPR) repeat protein
LPLYLSLLTSNPHAEVDPNSDVVANFLRWIPEQEQVKRRLALDAALFSRPFNQDDLEAFAYLSENDRPSLFRWLTELPFVQSSLQDGRYNYHELIQELSARHLYRRSQKEYSTSREALSDYYRKMLEKKQKDGGKEVYHSAEWLELSIALAQQLFLLPDESSHIETIEQILGAYQYQNAGQEEQIVRTLRELSKDQFNNQINPDSRKISQMLLQYIEADLTHQHEDLLAAVNYLLEKVSQATLFPVKLLANLYYKRGKANQFLKMYQRALEDFDRAIELDKENAEPIFARAQTYRTMKRYEEALADLDRAIELNSGFTHVGQEQKGEIFQSRRDYEKAAEAFTKAIVANPTCMVGWDSLLKVNAILYPRHKIPELLRAIPLSNDITSLSLCNRARAMSDMGLYEEALIDLDYAFELKPNDTQIYTYRGETFAKQKLYEKAIADFTSAINIVPNNARALIDRGRVYRLMRSYEEALADFNSIIEYYSSDQSISNEDRIERFEKLFIVRNQRGKLYPYRSLDIALFERSLAYRTMGRYEEALADLDRAIELDKENAEPIYARAQTYRAMGRYEEALAEFDRAIKLNSGFVHIGQKARGQIFNTLRRHEEAINAFIKALADHPICEGCWTLLAKTYGMMYSQAEVPKLLREVTISSNNLTLVFVNRAMALKNIGNYEEALADLTRASELRPDNALILVQRGRIYKELRRYEEALADFTQANKFDNSIIKDWWNEQGLMLSYLGRYDEAIEIYEQGLKEDSNNYSALYNIAVAQAVGGFPTAQTYIDRARMVFNNMLNTDTSGAALYGIGSLEALTTNPDLALDYLRQAVLKNKNAANWAYHDIAWLKLRNDSRFQKLTTSELGLVSPQQDEQ